MHDWMVNECKGNIGLNLFDMGKYEDSIGYYTEQIEADNNNGELYFWRGRAYRELALKTMRENNHQNNEISLDYFEKSSDDYQTALDLHNKQD